MIKDENYKTKSTTNRGEVGEKITFSILSKTFGNNNIFRGVKINKSKSETITDIDVLAINDDTGIIFQVKSKKLTNLSKQGNLKNIYEDFNKAVENAFLQGRESKECILNHGDYKFTNNKLTDVTDIISNIKNIYVVCIVLDEFPGITHTAQVLLYDKYPDSTVALSVLELDMICQVLRYPKRVIDYLRKRIENCRYYHSDTEASFLGYYLSHDLRPSSKVNGVYLDPSFANKLNTIYNNKYIKANAQVVRKRKIGRNDKCSCGSGKKNKNCCQIK